MLDFTDRLLRRNKYLPRLSIFRSIFRRPYHWLLSLGNGLPLNVGGVLPIRLPARYLAKEQEAYEAENYAALKRWIDANSGSWIIDLGCSFGYFSCAALFQSSVDTVVAIDADAESLAITKKVCCYSPQVSRRLLLLNCLVTNQSSATMTVSDLRLHTLQRLQSGGLTGDPRKISYVNADTQILESQLPRTSLDALVTEMVPNFAPLLIKIDVEGAEFMILQSAGKTLTDRRPTLLLSVHPEYLPRFGSSVDEISQLLQKLGYRWKVLSIDHEEHWLCTPEF